MQRATRCRCYETPWHWSQFLWRARRSRWPRTSPRWWWANPRPWGLSLPQPAGQQQTGRWLEGRTDRQIKEHIHDTKVNNCYQVIICQVLKMLFWSNDNRSVGLSNCLYTTTESSHKYAVQSFWHLRPCIEIRHKEVANEGYLDMIAASKKRNLPHYTLHGGEYVAKLSASVVVLPRYLLIISCLLQHRRPWTNAATHRRTWAEDVVLLFTSGIPQLLL